jgi:lipopolysaccharide export system permease protein
VKVVDMHIARAVLAASLVVLVGFVGLQTVFAFVEELQEDEAGYTLVEALQYVALTTPRRVYELIPYVAFLGSLIGLGTLASNSELVVMRAAGMSLGRIFVGVAWAAGVLLLFGLLIGELLAPVAEEAGEARKRRAQQSSETIHLLGTYWYREGGLYMNVDGLGQDGRLLGLRQFMLDDDERMIFSRAAESAYFQATASPPHWILRGVRETWFHAERTEVRQLDEVVWNSSVTPRLLSLRVLVAPRKLSMLDLRAQIQHMSREGLNPVSYQLAFWSKALQPLSILGLSLLALSFVVGPLREVSIGVRVSVGVLVGLGFKYLQDLFAPMSTVFGWPPVLCVLIPIAACWMVGWWGQWRAR